ncbi:MAG: WD40 repeat domain-containing protein [Lachnospiraceae bacterium]|nr:WD40 repeat domain-containing protein [Lachnospiraceae bacterium]
MIKNRAKKHAWENTVPGMDIYRELFQATSVKKMKHSPDGLILESISKNGEFTARAYNDGALHVFRKGEFYYVLERGVARLKAAAISGDGRRAATLSQQTFGVFRRVQLWDLEEKQRTGECFVEKDIINIHLSETGEWVIGERDGSYRIWNWENDKDPFELSGSLISNQHGKLTTHGNKVLFKNSENILEVFDLETREFSSIENLRKNARIADFLPNGELVVVGNNANKAILHSTRDGREMSLNSEEAAVTGIYCMKAQPFVGIATSNQKLCFYHTGTGQRTRILDTASGNKIIVGHRSKDVVACSGGGNQFETFNYFSFKTNAGRNAGMWYQNQMDHKFYGDVLDMDFNEANKVLVTIMSDGLIVYSHELYCKYHGSIQIITNINVDAYDFNGVLCSDEIRDNLRCNGAVI